MREVFAEIAQIFRVGLTTDPYSDFFLPLSAQSVRTKPALRVVPLEGTPRDISYGSTGATNEEFAVPWDFNLTPKAIQEIPASVEVSVSDPAKDSENSSVTVRRPTLGASEAFTLTTNATVADRETVNNIANYILELGFARGKVLQGDLTPSTTVLTPNTVASFQQLLVDRTGDQFSDTTVTNSTAQSAVVTIGANGIIEFEGYISDTEIVDTTFVQDLVLEPSALNPILCGRTLLFEGPAINSPISGNRRTLNVLYAPIPGFSTAAVGGLVLSNDGGTTFSTTAQTALGQNAEILTVTSVAPGARPELELIDRGTVIGVTVSNGVELSSIAESRLYDFDANVMFIPDYGLMAFATATLTGTNTYELSNILWNLGSSYLDYDNGIALNFTEAWLLLGRPHETVVSSGFMVGDQVTGLITPGGAATCTPAPVIEYRGLNSAPRPPASLRSFIQNDGSVRFEWVRGVSQETSPSAIPGITEGDNPNDEANERYQVYLTNNAGITRTIFVENQQFAVYTAAEIAADAVNVADLQWGVVQTGALNTIDIVDENWRWVSVDV